MNEIPKKEEMEQALIGRIGAKMQKKLKDSSVAICGLGGLGSNVAIALARANVGKLILIDFDRIDITNLNRQQYRANQIGEYKADMLAKNLKEISPYIEIVPIVTRLEQSNYMSLLLETDIICEAFDKAEEKSKLVHFVLEYMPDKYLVSASGMAGIGSPNMIKTRKITDKFYLCGDGVSDVNKGESLFSARVMLCASHQATTILRIIVGEYEL